MIESLLFYRSWSRSRCKKYPEPEPVKNGPVPQEWVPVYFLKFSSLKLIFSKKMYKNKAISFVFPFFPVLIVWTMFGSVPYLSTTLLKSFEGSTGITDIFI